MSTVVANSNDGAPSRRNSKKLVIIIAVVLLVVGLGGVAALMFMKNKQTAQTEDGDEEVTQTAAHTKHDAKHAPTFVPLDPFTVNLADKDADRFAQVGLTFELVDPKTAEDIKAYMPVIRNNILLVLAHKTAPELQGREGKERLAMEIKREACAALGIEIDIEDELAAASDEKASAPARNKKKSKRRTSASPIRQVHFSNFIIQ
jgi:flagellar FliL protein